MIEVEDEGPGLAAGEEESVFERFHRGRAGSRGPAGHRPRPADRARARPALGRRGHDREPRRPRCPRDPQIPRLYELFTRRRLAWNCAPQDACMDPGRPARPGGRRRRDGGRKSPVEPAGRAGVGAAVRGVAAGTGRRAGAELAHTPRSPAGRQCPPKVTTTTTPSTPAPPPDEATGDGDGDADD